MEIKTAEEIYEEHGCSKKSEILEAMKEYAEQFIDLVYEQGFSDGRGRSSGWEVNKKESILKVKQLIK